MLRVAPGRAKPSRASNFELWSWLFMRVSAVLLLSMALAHFAIMHVFNTPDQVNYDFVAARFATPFWRVYDLVLLGLGVLHGMNGVRIVIDDYIHSRGWRVLVMSLLWVVTFVFLVIGTQVVLSFQPEVIR
ncbi:MAG TPA: succinate dehydrogenase, hydrophobic membrane anchor protein [Chloroflexota bacterium]|nr:succinate dehydrogenase, hydrophobic membrane anchor protein [Chloroflexota bacterium]